MVEVTQWSYEGRESDDTNSLRVVSSERFRQTWGARAYHTLRKVVIVVVGRRRRDGVFIGHWSLGHELPL